MNSLRSFRRTEGRFHDSARTQTSEELMQISQQRQAAAMARAEQIFNRNRSPSHAENLELMLLEQECPVIRDLKDAWMDRRRSEHAA